MFISKYSNDIKIIVKGDKVIVRLSGGADSALLLWMVCDSWKKAGMDNDLNIYPITVIHGQRPWQSYYVQHIIDIVREDFPTINIHAPKTRLCEKPKVDYVDYQENLIQEIVDKHGECMRFNGVTLNPPKEIGESYWGDGEEYGHIWDNRELHRDWENRESKFSKLFRDEWHCNPFYTSHKGHIAELYKELGLLEKLLPFTRSCEGWAHITKSFTEVCNQCWWCRERDWAFNDYNS